MTSYILYKREIIWLMSETGYVNSDISKWLDNSAAMDDDMVSRSLLRKGIIVGTDGKYSIERTAAFLMFQLSVAEKVVCNDSIDLRICKCPKMYIILSDDTYDSEKCKLTPVRDRAELDEYISEHDLEISEELL